MKGDDFGLNSHLQEEKKALKMINIKINFFLTLISSKDFLE